MQENMSSHDLNKQQKTGFVLLLIFAVLAVGLGFLQIRNTIYNPFVITAASEEETQLTTLADDATRLQAIDTDQDGLNDYEELNFYETSPYLPDTDSDGIKDKEELEKGTDPLCAEGSECNANELPSANNETAGLSDLAEEATLPVGQAAQNLNSDSVLTDLNSLSNNPAKIREMILASGQMTKEQLDAVDDATLLNTVKQLLEENKSAE
jgi:hypothetical protein